MLINEKFKKSWNEWVINSEDEFKAVGRPSDQSKLTLVLKDIEVNLGVGKNDKLLDVGCGTGLFLEYFSDKVKETVGVDYSKEMIDKAKLTFPNHSFYIAPANCLPFESESFDLIICYSVFHYLNNYNTAIKVINELLRVTRPGGRIFLGDIPSKSHYKKLFPKYKKILQIMYQSFKNKKLKLNNKKSFENYFLHNPNNWLFFDLVKLTTFIKKNVGAVFIKNQIPNIQWNTDSYKYRFDIIIRK